MWQISLNVNWSTKGVLQSWSTEPNRNWFFFFLKNLGFKMQKTRRKLCLWRTASFFRHLSSLGPADPAQWTTGEETKFPSLSVCKAASFPGQRTEQAAINYKEILSSCGRFCNNVSIQSKQIWCVWELGALYSCHTKSRPADPLTADQRGVTTGGWGVCYLHAAAL